MFDSNNAGYFHRIILAAAASLIFHISLFVFLPENFATLEPTTRNTFTEIEYIIPPEEKPLKQFVETNPDVPENEPDETDNFSDRDQQAADEAEEKLTVSDAPKVDGDKPSQKIIEGDLSISQPSQPSIVSESTTPSEKTTKESLAVEPATSSPTSLGVPRKSMEIIEGTGEGITLKKIEIEEEEETQEETAKTISLNNELLKSPAQENAETNSKQKPRPRIKLLTTVINGPLMRNLNSSSKAGQIGINSKMNEFGEYTQRYREAIYKQWITLISEITLGSEDVPSTVSIAFIMTSEGRIKDLTIIDTSAGQLTSHICEDAIRSRSPFGNWTDSMIQTLGEETEITINFHYHF